jgi:hypothetical protein
VEICHGADLVATHRRCWDKGQTVYEPRHYLPLLDRKPGALDHGRPLQALDLPECFALLRRRLESENGHKGTKDYITVLRLLEAHTTRRVAAAIEKAMFIGAPSPDVVAMYLYPDQLTEPGTFVLAGRPQLRAIHIAPPCPAAYANLLAVEVAS